MRVEEITEDQQELRPLRILAQIIAERYIVERGFREKVVNK